ncbi:RNA 2',3'-cyclic phosphodiesterase [Photobacterium alginatilyticum]|uniref:RNA 2',3'-cyclic phosphodiesterase n=1 Tax=Photobacterium alginatilyticum TaxID=1775171 RepID=UPI0040679246
MNVNKQERLFFALALDTPANQRTFLQLSQLAQILPGEGRRVPDSNLHLTLAFLGLVNEQQKAHLIDLTNTVAGPSFTFHASALKYRKRNRLIWLEGDTIPVPLAQLASNLKEAALQTGLEQEKRSYTPHITLKKQVRQRPDPMPENVHFSFYFQHFGLYISEQVNTARGSGVRYRCLRQWPLTPTQPDNQDLE